jgi:hypothetical protein
VFSFGEGGTGGEGRKEGRIREKLRYAEQIERQRRGKEIGARKETQNLQNGIKIRTVGHVMLQALRVNCGSVMTTIGKTCSSKESKNALAAETCGLISSDCIRGDI